MVSILGTLIISEVVEVYISTASSLTAGRGGIP